MIDINTSAAPVFRPIQINVSSVEEWNALKAIADHSYRNSSHGSVVETAAKSWRDALDAFESEDF